jgi:(p)ppGpp synthase/HD superfamily hydrolase
MSDGLSRAIVFAANYHAGQKDKGGEPYILHPLRVMMEMETEDEKVVAVLHDVLEDTDATEEEIEEHFGRWVLNEVLTLTRRGRTEVYFDYIDRVAEDSFARKIKWADILDNLNPDREFPGHDGLKSRYRKALAIIEESEKRDLRRGTGFLTNV